MSDAFKLRYGADFIPIANGINPADWPQLRDHKAGPMLVRYSGGLAADMTLTSVLRVARMVEKLADSGVPVTFEINTQKWWLDKSGAQFKDFKHTTISSEVLPTDTYRAWLSAADLVVIAYNFDPATLRYVQYSMANKTPECLASGAALLAIGPREIATIGYLAESGAAHVVDRDSDAAVEDALRQLQAQPERRAMLAAAGQTLATTRHNVDTLRDQLRGVFMAAARPVKPEAPAPVAAELEQLRANFKALSDFATELEARVAGPRVLGAGATVLERLCGAKDAESARLLLTTVGSGLLLDSAAMAARLAGEPVLRAGVDSALSLLPEGDAHRVQFLRVRQRAG